MKPPKPTRKPKPPKKPKAKLRPPVIHIDPDILRVLVKPAADRGATLEVEVNDRLRESLAQPAVERLVFRVGFIHAEIKELTTRVAVLEAAASAESEREELLLMPVRRKRGDGR